MLGAELNEILQYCAPGSSSTDYCAPISTFATRDLVAKVDVGHGPGSSREKPFLPYK